MTANVVSKKCLPENVAWNWVGNWAGNRTSPHRDGVCPKTEMTEMPEMLLKAIEKKQ
jgi:hypothetical protein